MKKEILTLLKIYENQASFSEASFKHYSQGYSQGPADPKPYIEGGVEIPYYDYSEGGYSEYTDW